MKTLITLLTLAGVITWYGGISYIGQPLFCDTNGTMRYDSSIDWVALPLDGDWECGDSILIRMGDYSMVLPVLDTGPFGDNYVVQSDGSLLAIRADIPQHLWPYDGKLSAQATVLNLSLLNRLLPQDVKVGYLRQ